MIRYLVIILLLLAGLYFGVAGWQGTKALEKTSVDRSRQGNEQSYEFEGLVFKDEESLREFLRERTSNRWFPWIFSIPQDVIPLVAAIAFGFFGGAIRLLRKLARGSEDIPFVRLFTEPCFGAVIGLMVFFLSLLLPVVFSSGRNPVRPEAVVGFSLFGGIFSEQAYQWIEKQVLQSLFSSHRRNQDRRR